jgi:hypothetical protein
MRAVPADPAPMGPTAFLATTNARSPSRSTCSNVPVTMIGTPLGQVATSPKGHNRVVSHRSVAFLGLLALLAAACGSEATAGRTHTEASTFRPPETSIAKSDAQPPISITTPACTPDELAIHGGRQAGGFHGVAVGSVVLTDISQRSCTLNGDPGVQLLTTSGTVLVIAHRPNIDPAHSPAVLSPGNTATLALAWDNWCLPSPGPLDVELTLGQGQLTITGPFDGPPSYDLVPACADPSQPSTLGVIDGGYMTP